MCLYRGIVTSKLPLQGYGRKITKKSSHLIFAACYVLDTYCSRHFNFATFS